MNKLSVILYIILLLSVAILGLGIWTLFIREQEPNQNINDNQQTKAFTTEEVASHDTNQDCWTIISGDVYNLTDYINRHPGGSEILRACGADATTLFTERKTNDNERVGSGAPHSRAAEEQLERLKIGTLIR